MIRSHVAHRGVSPCSSTVARVVKTSVPARMPPVQPARNAVLAARGRSVNSSRIAGMIGKGEAAMATASGRISASTAPTKCPFRPSPDG